MAQHIRKGDMVMVITGNDRKRTGRVLRVLPKRGKVVVEGMGMRRKHVKPSQKNPQGGLVEREAALDLSNVQPVVDGKPTRVRFHTEPSGKKTRVAVRGGVTLGEPIRKGGK